MDEDLDEKQGRWDVLKADLTGLMVNIGMPYLGEEAALGRDKRVPKGHSDQKGTKKGTKGYLRGTVISTSNLPPSYGLPSGPRMVALSGAPVALGMDSHTPHSLSGTKSSDISFSILVVASLLSFWKMFELETRV